MRSKRFLWVENWHQKLFEITSGSWTRSKSLDHRKHRVKEYLGNWMINISSGSQPKSRTVFDMASQSINLQQASYRIMSLTVTTVDLKQIEPLSPPTRKTARNPTALCVTYLTQMQQHGVHDRRDRSLDRSIIAKYRAPKHRPSNGLRSQRQGPQCGSKSWKSKEHNVALELKSQYNGLHDIKTWNCLSNGEKYQAFHPQQASGPQTSSPASVRNTSGVSLLLEPYVALWSRKAIEHGRTVQLESSKLVEQHFKIGALLEKGLWKWNDK